MEARGLRFYELLHSAETKVKEYERVNTTLNSEADAIAGAAGERADELLRLEEQLKRLEDDLLARKATWVEDMDNLRTTLTQDRENVDAEYDRVIPVLEAQLVDFPQEVAERKAAAEQVEGELTHHQQTAARIQRDYDDLMEKYEALQVEFSRASPRGRLAQQMNALAGAIDDLETGQLERSMHASERGLRELAEPNAFPSSQEYEIPFTSV